MPQVALGYLSAQASQVMMKREESPPSKVVLQAAPPEAAGGQDSSYGPIRPWDLGFLT